MLEKLKQMVQALVRQATPVDPAVFDDPLALRTEWTPAASGGANFRTHRLVEAGPGRLQFRATLGMTLFALVFAAAGAFAAAMGFMIPGPSPETAGFQWERLFPALFGGVFMLIGALMLAFSRRTIMFDRGSGWFWKGWRAPVPGAEMGKRACRLSDIRALQLIRERVSGKNSSYWSHELNLVLRDGRRINVVDHGNIEKLREDAGRVAVLLGCKVWDATAPPPPKPP